MRICSWIASEKFCTSSVQTNAYGFRARSSYHRAKHAMFPRTVSAVCPSGAAWVA